MVHVSTTHEMARPMPGPRIQSSLALGGWGAAL